MKPFLFWFTSRFLKIISSTQENPHLKSAPTIAAPNVSIFDTESAHAINAARIEHLQKLDLPLKGKRVLDVGCGPGYFTRFFINQQCSVVGVDAREENIKKLRSQYSDVDARVLDIEKDPVQPLGTFPVIFCYGLLYHLENPILVIEKLSALCTEFLILETIITDHPLPLSCLVCETSHPNQALRGVGHRPTPAYVVAALQHAGFSKIYTPVFPPHHPDFIFERKNDLSCQRNGHNLRSIFIASKIPLDENRQLSLLAASATHS